MAPLVLKVSMERVRVDEASQTKMLERCVAQLAWLIWLMVTVPSPWRSRSGHGTFPNLQTFEHSLKSNLPAYVRNKLRGDVIPLLEQHNDVVDHTVDVIVVAIAGLHFDAYCESLGWRIENISKRRTELRLRQTLKLFDETEAVKCRVSKCPHSPQKSAQSIWLFVSHLVTIF